MSYFCYVAAFFSFTFTFVFGSPSVGAGPPANCSALFYRPSAKQVLLRSSLREIVAEPLRIEDIHYQDTGNPLNPVLVLIHGRDSRLETFTKLIPKLSEHVRIVAIDQRGHGRSKAVGRDYRSDILAADIAVVLDHLGIEQAHFLGHSLGARTITRFAELYPERTLSLIIEDMELQSRRPLTEKALIEMEALYEKLSHLPLKVESEAAFFAAYEPIFKIKGAKSILKYRTHKNPDGSIDVLYQPSAGALYSGYTNTEDFSVALKSFPGPVLFVMADPKRNSAVTTRGLLHMQSVRPDAEIRLLTGTGHSVHKSKSTGFAKLVLRFVRSVR